MRHSWFDLWLVCFAVVLLAGCTDYSAPTDATAGDATTTVSSSGEMPLTDEPTTTDAVAPNKAEEATSEIDTLTIGDAAPPLAVTSWVKGSQVDAFEAGHIYVVEFWATWCGPCKAGMPHISQLQDEYQDEVTFIGISDEDPNTVEEFFESEQREGTTWNEVADYTFAIDGDQVTGQAYMEAAGQSGIPTAFVVGRDGHVEWIGHPMDIDGPIERIVHDQWDRVAFANEFESARAAQDALNAASPRLRSLLADENWDEAITIFDELYSRFPGNPEIGQLRANLLINADRASEGISALHEVAKANWDDAPRLNGIAWAMATRIPADVRDLDVTLEIANRANELTEEQDASILDTVARVYYEQGQLEQAITWQEKAVEASQADRSLQKTLDDYIQQRDRDGDEADPAPNDGESSEDA